VVRGPQLYLMPITVYKTEQLYCIFVELLTAIVIQQAKDLEERRLKNNILTSTGNVGLIYCRPI